MELRSSGGKFVPVLEGVFDGVGVLLSVLGDGVAEIRHAPQACMQDDPQSAVLLPHMPYVLQHKLLAHRNRAKGPQTPRIATGNVTSAATREVNTKQMTKTICSFIRACMKNKVGYACDTV